MTRPGAGSGSAQTHASQGQDAECSRSLLRCSKSRWLFAASQAASALGLFETAPSADHQGARECEREAQAGQVQRGRCRRCFWSARYRLNRVRHFVHPQLGTVGDQAKGAHDQDDQQDAGKSARRHRTRDGVSSCVRGSHGGEANQFVAQTTTSRSNFPECLELPRG